MIATICILSVLLIVSIFANVNLLRKIEKTDDELTNVSLDMEDFIGNVNRAYEAIKKADSKGSFESDDEIGTVFEEIKRVITELKLRYNIQEKTDED